MRHSVSKINDRFCKSTYGGAGDTCPLKYLIILFSDGVQNFFFLI